MDGAWTAALPDASTPDDDNYFHQGPTIAIGPSDTCSDTHAAFSSAHASS
jgi:hypothetical protein